MKFLRQMATNVLLISTLFASVAIATNISIASAASTDSATYACEGIALTGQDCGPNAAGPASRVSNVIKLIVNILTTIVGVAAVIMIIFSGFKYITSNGDASKIASAKNTVIYAIVGLIIVAMAQVITNFVIDKTT